LRESLDIFFLVGVADEAVHMDLAEGDIVGQLQAIMIMRATQKNRMSKPVSSATWGRTCADRGYRPASRRRERPQAGAEPRVEDVGVCSMFFEPHWRTHLAADGPRCTGTIGAMPPGCDGPTKLARDAPVAEFFIQLKYVLFQFSGTKRMGPSASG